GGTAAGVWELARRKHLSPPEYRVLPHNPWTPVERPAGRADVPPLLRGYLRLGAWICGAPALDPDFGCADFFVLLSLDRLGARYLRHSLGEPWGPQRSEYPPRHVARTACAAMSRVGWGSGSRPPG